MKIDLQFLQPVYAEILNAVERAEVLFPEIGKGTDKKKFVLDVICKAWAWPFPFSLFERFLFGLLIDLVVYLYNHWFGKAWVRNIPESRQKSFQAIGVE